MPPLGPDASRSAGPDDGDVVRGVPRRLRCLVVDDEPEIVRVVEAILTPALRVEAAGDGGTALHVIQRNPPDVLLLDLKLPDMYGLHVLDTVRRMRPDLIVIIMTGHSSEPVAIAAANLAVSGYLVKSFGVVDLRQAMVNALALRLCRRLEASDEPMALARTVAGGEIPRLHADSTTMHPITAAAALRRLARLPQSSVLARRRGLIRSARIERRIERAKTLLGGTSEPMKAIAAELGFHDAAHFCRQFRRWVGQTPLTYRRRAQASRVI